MMTIQHRNFREDCKGHVGPDGRRQIAIRLPEYVYEELREFAREAGIPVSRAASRLIENALMEIEAK